jgi:HSP20 family protein
MSEKATASQKAPENKKQTQLKVVEPEALFERIGRMHDAIERRAFEIFDLNGRTFGRELDDWFKAETELLHPVHLKVSEAGDSLQVEAEVPGFDANDFEVSVEPQRLTISGKKQTTEESKTGNTVYKDQCSNEILRVVDLPAEVETAKVAATLKNGVLSLTLPKAARPKAGAAKVEVKSA